MDHALWKRIESILDKALELEPNEREPLVNQLAGDDTFIYSRVIQLLKSIEEADSTGFLETDKFGRDELLKELAEAPANLSAKEKMIGRKIGPFKLTEILGSGGMAVVYKGEREKEPTTQQVAIKILYKNIHDQESLFRFKMEQEILANLNHPNIAHFIDTGITEEGNPYFIMEYVEGELITDYCTHHSLTTSEKIKLFKQVCRAVRFAHRNMVVHRDLKPSNIFVTSRGRVKVLDFSIAKLLYPLQSDEKQLETQTGIRLLSPTYCAPEQFQMTPITTATDIYTLGLMLYEILTGNKAVDKTKKTLKEIEKTICESDFNSTLTFNINPDLKAIILKATRKEPEYRYESAGQLLEELERYEESMPLIAQKDSLTYRISKFGKRHAKALTATATIIVLFLSTIILYTYQIEQERDKAALEAERAQKTTRFLTSIFESASIANYTNNPTAKELLKQGSLNARRSQELKPKTKEFLLRNFARIYYSLGFYNKADTLIKESLVLCEQIYAKQSEGAAHCLYDYGSIQMGLKNYEEAQKYLSTSSNIAKSKPNVPEMKYLLASNYDELGWLNYELGNYKKADSLLDIVYQMHELHLNKNQEEFGIVFLYKAWVSNALGNYKKADSLFNRSISILENYRPNQDSYLVKALTGRGRNYYDAGIIDKADSLINMALPLSKKMYREPSVAYGNALKIAGLIKTKLEQYEQAKKFLNQALYNYENTIGEVTDAYNIALNDLAIVHFRLGNHEKAIETFKKLIASNKKLLGPNHPEIATGLSNLATILDLTGQTKASIPYFKEAIQIAETSYASSHPDLIRFKKNTIKALINIEEYEDAEKLLTESMEALKKSGKMNESEIINKYYPDFLSEIVLVYRMMDNNKLAAKYDSLRNRR